MEMTLIVKANLTSLPLELKIKVFRMITEYNDALSLTQVSHEWRKIGEDYRNWMITEMTLSSLPWKSVEGFLRKPERTRQLRSGRKVEGSERIRHLRSVKFEKMTSDGHGERILKKFADYGLVSHITLSGCLLFDISRKTEKIMERSKVKKIMMNNCTIRIPMSEDVVHLFGVGLRIDDGSTIQDGGIRFKLKKDLLFFKGCWANRSQWIYAFKTDRRKHPTIVGKNQHMFHDFLNK